MIEIAIVGVALAIALPGLASAETLTVNTNDDPVDFDESCDPAPGECTLREAIEVAAPDDIVVVPGDDPYVLNPQLGPLAIPASIAVVGAGARSTIISGGDALRVMQLTPGLVVAMSGVTLMDGNVASAAGPGLGGALLVPATSTLTLTDTTISGNSAGDLGGGIYSEGEVELVRSTVAGNDALSGAGIYQATGQNGSLTLTASTVSGNTARGSGGAITSLAPLVLTRSTITGNSAEGVPDALFLGGGTAQVTDTIIDAGGAQACIGQWASFTTAYSLVHGSGCPLGGTGNRQGDPMLGLLQNNGGQTNTHALLAGSPAIGAANPDPRLCTGTDQRGVTRPQQGTCDIGAFEYVPPPPPPSPPPQPGPPPPEEDQLPAPVAGKRVNLTLKSGRVRIKLRGTKKFVRLREGQQVPVGTIVDTRKGRVTLVAAADKTGKTATSVFWDGIFKIGQTKGRRPITTLKLTEKLSCGAGGKKASTAKKKKRKKGKRKRRLWGNGKGRFRTRGKYSAATVRGTKWLVEDRCTRTLTRVRRGRVSVRDFVKKKKVIVRAGKRYVARKAT